MNYCLIDLQLSDTCAKHHRKVLTMIVGRLGKQVSDNTIEDIRSFLLWLKANRKIKTYADYLCVLKRFFRDYLKRGDLVESFQFPEIPYVPKKIHSKEDIQVFYYALESLRDRAFYLVLACSGLRMGELLSLSRENIDLEMRMLTPKNAHSTNRTKNAWVSFINKEAVSILSEYISSHDEPRIFPHDATTMQRAFIKASQITGIKIKPKDLRDFFAQEMGNLGVADRYIDAFCGRTPKSILARHYSDYSPEKLKVVYDQANIKILEESAKEC